MPSQQMTTRSAPMDRVERTNTVVVRDAKQSMGVPLRRDPYAIEVDRERNCYAYGEFGHMACHCRNSGKERLMEGKRVEYGRGRIEEIYNHMNNLKGRENLELLD